MVFAAADNEYYVLKIYIYVGFSIVLHCSSTLGACFSYKEMDICIRRMTATQLVLYHFFVQFIIIGLN